MTSAIMPVCFTHRYSQLLEEGRVDGSTVIIDHDDFCYYQRQNRRLADIAKLFKVTKEQLKEVMALERKLVVADNEREREAALERLSEEYSEVPSILGSEASAEVDPVSRTESNAVIVVSDRPSDTNPVFRVRLMRDWCEARGMESTVFVCRDLSYMDPAKVCDSLIMWSKEDRPDEGDSVRALVDKGFKVVFLGEDRSLWDGVYATEDGNTTESRPKNNRWASFCWDHLRASNASRICRGGSHPTRFASLEDVVECSRLGIPLWAVARAIGITTVDLEFALDEEGFLVTYRDCLAGVETEDSPEVVSVSDAVPETVPDSVSDPVQGNVPDATVDGSEHEGEVFVHVEPERPMDLEPGPDSASPQVVVIADSLITESGALSIIDTVVNGADPNPNLWTKVEGGWIIRSHRARIAYSGGKAAYCNEVESLIVRARYVPIAETVRVVFEREGLHYAEKGRLYLDLDDRTCIGVPVVSDYPIVERRWLA